MMNTISAILYTQQRPAKVGRHASSPTKRKKHTVASAPWYYGILKEDTTTSHDFKVDVVDTGGFIEFVLPRGTAQFAEMFVRDTNGNLVWKTQTFNAATIVWDKKNIFGGKVPKGTYTFLMKQSNRQINGSVEISQ